jgi:hypothetical protein
MTRKITMKALKPLDEAEQDLAALADQWVDRNFYLPPGGDHSWREREAQRLFGNDGKEPINDEANVPPAGWAAPAAGEANGPYEPGFRRAGARNILLPVSLAACALLFAGGFWISQILSSGFWGPQEPKIPPATPHMINVAAEGKAMPALAYAGDPDLDGNRAANRPRPRPPGPAIAPAKADGKGTPPRLRPPIVAKPDAPDAKPVVRAAKAQAPGVRSSRKQPAKSLPPIGAAYFASHAPAAAAPRRQVAGSLPPIGQAYFESRARAVSD